MILHLTPLGRLRPVSLAAFIALVLCLGRVGVWADAPAPAPVTQPTSAPAKPEVSDDVLAAFKPHTVEKGGKVVLRYRMLEPAEIKTGERYPLVMFLHGSGERGDDNYRQLIHGGAEFLGHSQRHPAFYVVPQCPKGIWWSSDNKLRDEPEEPGVVPPMDEIVALLNAMVQSKPIDPNRIYVAGLSMGGFGTYDLVLRLPTTFAAAIPMCGGGDASQAAKYKSTPFWIFHGSDDTAVDVKFSRTMVEAMHAAGVKVIYTEYPGGNHNAWTPTLTNMAVIDWMFAQHRR